MCSRSDILVILIFLSNGINLRFKHYVISTSTLDFTYPDPFDTNSCFEQSAKLLI